MAGYSAFEAEVGNNVNTPTLLPGLAGHGAVVGAALSGVGSSPGAALLLCSDGTVLGCGRDKTDNGRVLARLVPAQGLALTPLPLLRR
jgi:hypothetical protein